MRYSRDSSLFTAGSVDDAGLVLNDGDLVSPPVTGGVDRGEPKWNHVVVSIGRVAAVLLFFLASPAPAFAQAPPRSVVTPNDSGRPFEFPPISWSTDLKAAFGEAVQVHRPLVLFLAAPWCRYCVTLERDFSFDPQYYPYHDRAVFVVLDPEDHEAGTAVAEGFKVTEYPTVIVFDTSHNSLAEIGRLVGYMPPEKFIPAMEEYLDEAHGSLSTR